MKKKKQLRILRTLQKKEKQLRILRRKRALQKKEKLLEKQILQKERKQLRILRKKPSKIPKITIPYTKVYEPETSWSMSATVAWRADENAVAAADPSASVRPATIFVWLDSDLKVYDRNGKILSENLESYVKSTCAGAIPAFYIRDGETAAALKEAIVQMGLQDCFVVSSGENRELIKDAADLLHVRGMLDFTSVSSPDRKKLAEMIKRAAQGTTEKIQAAGQARAVQEHLPAQGMTAI